MLLIGIGVLVLGLGVIGIAGAMIQNVQLTKAEITKNDERNEKLGL